jgi:outer membrane usher protein
VRAAIALAACCVAWLTTAAAASERPAGHILQDAHASEALLLDLQVNGQPIAGVHAAARLSDGSLVLSEEGWQASRLIPLAQRMPMPEGGHGYRLEDVAGLGYGIDAASLRLRITAPPQAFVASRVAASGAAQRLSPSPAPPGAYLNYDVVASQASGGASTQAVLVEAVGFHGAGLLSSSAVIRRAASIAQDRVLATRGDTTLRIRRPEAMQTVLIGDAISSDSAWSRQIRFGGVRWTRDLSLGPGFLPQPLPSIAGSAALPATVEVLADQRSPVSHAVAPGPFAITDIPVVNGAGEVSVVVRDALGVETVITRRYYASPRILSAGFTDFSLEAGAPRLRWGGADSSYQGRFGAATVRHGVTDLLSIEARSELEATRHAAGLEAATLLGTIALARVAVAWSSSSLPPEAGARMLMGIERAGRGGMVSAQWDRFDPGFRQLGAVAGEPRPRERLQLAAGGPLGRGHRLSAGVTVAHQSSWGGAPFTLAGLHVGLPLALRMHLVGHGSREWSGFDRWRAGISLMVPMGRRGTASAALLHGSDGGTVPTLSAWHAPEDPDGWAWRGRASGGVAGRLQPGASRSGRLGEFFADASLGSDDTALRLGVSGAMGVVAGVGPFATRRIGNEALAVVQVGDLEGMPVAHAHRAVATTGPQGVALVTGLLPYQANRLDIDAQHLPLQVAATQLSFDAVPHARAAVLVDFGLRRMHDVLVVLRAPDGGPVPEGAQARVLPDGPAQQVARRGEAYLPDVPRAGRIAVRWGETACEADYAIGDAAEAMPVLGPIDCLVAQ